MSWVLGLESLVLPLGSQVPPVRWVPDFILRSRQQPRVTSPTFQICQFFCKCWQICVVYVLFHFISIAIWILLGRTSVLLKKKRPSQRFSFKFYEIFHNNCLQNTCVWPWTIFIISWCVSIVNFNSLHFFPKTVAKRCSKNFHKTLRKISVTES